MVGKVFCRGIPAHLLAIAEADRKADEERAAANLAAAKARGDEIIFPGKRTVRHEYSASTPEQLKII